MPCCSVEDPGDFSGVLEEYHDLRMVFSRSRAASLPPHSPYDCSIDLLPARARGRGEDSRPGTEAGPAERAALESSRADAHKSGMSFTATPGHHGPWVHPQRRTRAGSRATTSPPPAFEISIQNRFAPLRETGRDAVIIGDSIVRHIPAILKDDESPRAVVLHAGANDTMLRQTEMLKRDFRSLIETVRSTTPAATIVVSGPLPTYQQGHERFSRLFALNEWLLSWCKEQKLLFVNNWNLFWERPRLFRADGLHPSKIGAELLSDNISRTLHSM
ncbi:uncharacterized protein LOC127977408 [Carassius gibelio]|uniref:uncharacterized protein LOC127977408 n=1 Tax=Carassius gibelio TaxID=101364 RepID=UPI0022789775|nr:uncharacterized protein LOC127977408 [Carassius gibelio]